MFSDFNRRFEELSDGAGDEPKAPEPKPLKRPRDEAMETDEQPADKLSKSAKKKAKKQKGEDGKAVPVVIEEKAAEPKGEKKADKKEEKKEKKKQKAAEEKKGGAYQELAGGVKIRDVKTGDGKTAKSGARVSMRYVGKLQNKQIFDQNVKGKPVSNFFSALATRVFIMLQFTFKLGAGDVIKGL
jgi:FK506-binding nuclear protein